MYERILVPVDGSTPAERAVGYGVLLTEAYDAGLELLHVPASDREVSDGDAGTKGDRGETVLATARDLVGDLVPVETRQLDGAPHRVIRDVVADSTADLVVIGRRGRAGLGEGLLGSVTERVIVGVDAPVLVVPETAPEAAPGDISTVLLPTDGSENAEAASAPAADLVGQFGATLHVVNVVNVEAAGGPFSAGGITEEFVERLEEGGAEAVEEMVEAVRAVDPDRDPTTAVVHGTPHEGIDEYATEHGVDLVAMGSRGRSTIERQLFGSVTKRVLRTVDVPVLVVRGGE